MKKKKPKKKNVITSMQPEIKDFKIKVHGERQTNYKIESGNK